MEKRNTKKVNEPRVNGFKGMKARSKAEKNHQKIALTHSHVNTYWHSTIWLRAFDVPKQ